jgi:hypothetical protein
VLVQSLYTRHVEIHELKTCDENEQVSIYTAYVNLFFGCRVRREIQRDCLGNKATDYLLSLLKNFFNDLHEDSNWPDPG